MKSWRIEYTPDYRCSPMSFWVHRNLGDQPWLWSSQFAPPLPKAIPCRGYPALRVEAQGVDLRFASIEEARHFLEVIAQKNLPTTRQLSARRIHNHGPNSHWLSRLPARLKPWRRRQRLIPLLQQAIRAFERVYD